jgi:hypothetical protein
MQRDLFIHYAFWFAFFVLISILGDKVSLTYWPFWVGGAIGTILPDIDHLIYIFFLNPHELTSQRINYLIKKKEVTRARTLLYETKSERRNMIFHSFLFQVIFMILTFLIISSSGSVFVYGIVLAFSLHFLVDQFIDIVDNKNLNNWGQLITGGLDYRKSIIYITGSFILLFVMGLSA